MTCIGNSGPLPEPVVGAVDQGDLVCAGVLSGNRFAAVCFVVEECVSGTLRDGSIRTPEPTTWPAPSL